MQCSDIVYISWFTIISVDVIYIGVRLAGAVIEVGMIFFFKKIIIQFFYYDICLTINIYKNLISIEIVMIVRLII